MKKNISLLMIFALLLTSLTAVAGTGKKKAARKAKAKQTKVYSAKKKEAKAKTAPKKEVKSDDLEEL